ncbi:MAG TPA: 2-oxoacid:acceptor oxidoreductase subunit alpha [Anaerolineaceae bacterium]|nr:2-oxoacid:acceptor oxidoreductase subunit alpha [Anaerolineaceae bacterium]
MTEGTTAVQIDSSETVHRIVNDFSITFGTTNGSGSQTANTTLLRAICHMGIPVSGKNIFPSNIQGLPTWYTIRVNKHGYLARKEISEIVIAMNPASFLKDVQSLPVGGVLFYADDIRLPIGREDITIYPMPVKKLAKEADAPSNLRDYIANMVYVGVVAQLLFIDLELIRKALDFHFKGKQKAVDSNFNVVLAGAAWAAANLVKKDPYRIEPMHETEGCILVDGNTAGALGAIFGGIQFAAWYPITPASTMPEALNEYLPLLRKDSETGRHTYAVVQAEDELAAAGMAVGAGWAGLRSMTATSGPGLSLMAEYAGLAYFSEVPIVIWDIQRVGPATGLPTRTAQGDLTEAAFFSHGDTQHVILLPGSVGECFEFGWKAFDLAERLQTPVFVLSDLDLGMNVWLSDRFVYPDRPMDRGKVLWEKDLETLGGEWSRYLDVDGDGITYRTIPGNRHSRSGYFTRGTGHDENARYSEEPEVWERNILRLARKYETAREYVPRPISQIQPGAKFGILAYGSTQSAIDEARDTLREEGIPTDFMRIRALPFTNDIGQFIDSHERIIVIELNRDGQMHQLLKIQFSDQCDKLISAAHVDGLPLTARWVVDQVKAQEVK